MSSSKLTSEAIQLAIREHGTLAELKTVEKLLSTDRSSEFLPLVDKLIENSRKHGLYELELYLRKLRGQHHIFYAVDPGEFLEACLEDVVAAHEVENPDGEMRHCIVENLMAAYSRMDSKFHAKQIMNLAHEHLQLMKEGSKCYNCHETFVIDGHISLKQYEEALSLIDRSSNSSDNPSMEYDKQRKKVDVYRDLGQFETAYQYIKNCERMIATFEEKISTYRQTSFHYVKCLIEAKLTFQDEAADTLLQVKDSWYSLLWMEYFLECLAALDVTRRSRLPPIDKHQIEKVYELCLRRRLSRSAFNINRQLFNILLSEERYSEASVIVERLEILSGSIPLRDEDLDIIRCLRQQLTDESSSKGTRD